MQKRTLLCAINLHFYPCPVSLAFHAANRLHHTIYYCTGWIEMSNREKIKKVNSLIALLDFFWPFIHIEFWSQQYWTSQMLRFQPFCNSRKVIFSHTYGLGILKSEHKITFGIFLDPPSFHNDVPGQWNDWKMLQTTLLHVKCYLQYRWVH